jgi:DNA-binding Lrp family transcriptional regulator
MSCEFDKTDVKIMKSLSEDCRKSTTQVAKETGISRPTAIARMKELVSNHLIDFGAKINVTRMGFKLAIVHLEVDNAKADKQIIRKLNMCPRTLQLVQTIGKSEYIAIVCAEDADTLLSTIDCLRSILDAKITSWERVKPILGESFNLKIFLEKCDLTPCGKKCGVCPRFEDSACIGCPATREYKGEL